jgi:uncharacterized ferredoxin-like protein
MSRISSTDAERQAIHAVATLMAAAARTAPKTRGVDTIQSLVVDGEDLETLAQAMEQAAGEQSSAMGPGFLRDARNVRASACVVLIGASGVPRKPEVPMDCGACGFRTCANLLNARAKTSRGTGFFGPVCAFASIDLGIAAGSAAKVAADNNVDNRIMRTIGTGAMRLKWLESDVILGIPLSATGKSPYFDRG